MDETFFDRKRYVPVLRWKYAEQRALAQVRPATAALITPLFEIVPDKVIESGGEVVSEQEIVTTASDMFRFWGDAPCFVDFLHVDLWNCPAMVDTKIRLLLANGPSARHTQLG